MADIVEMQPRLGVKRLNTLVDIRDEMERVYKATAKSKIDPSKGALMTKQLTQLLHATEIAAYEAVLDQAEEHFQRRG